MTKRISLFSMFIFCVLAVGGCEKSKTTNPPPSTPKDSPTRHTSHDGHDHGHGRHGSAPGPIRMVVMDPLAAELACACVAGFAQRDYPALATFLEKQLGRKVSVTFSESLQSIPDGVTPDIVIGKRAVIEHDAKKTNMPLTPLASLTGLKGSVTLRGLFVVRGDDPAETLADLKKGKYRIKFGPVEVIEKHQAGKDALTLAGITGLEVLDPAASCSEAALAVIEDQADLTVVSDYAMPLLDGCGTIHKGELKVIGETAPVPFITLFLHSTSEGVGKADLRQALEEVNRDTELLKKLESKKGFVVSVRGK